MIFLNWDVIFVVVTFGAFAEYVVIIFFFTSFAFLSSIIYYIYFWENPVIIFCSSY